MTFLLSRPTRIVWCSLAMLGSACSSLHLPGRTDPAGSKSARSSPVSASNPTAQTALPTAPNPRSQFNAGLDAYNSGDYPAAIRRLAVASDPGISDKPTQLEAIKYLAFSYCVTGQTTLCRLQFERALRIDPSFDLAPGEKGHPLWGPVFERAKKGKAG